jgi:hypothetical protein
VTLWSLPPRSPRPPLKQGDRTPYLKQMQCKVYLVVKILSYDITQSSRWPTMFRRNILLPSPEEVSISHLSEVSTSHLQQSVCPIFRGVSMSHHVWSQCVPLLVEAILPSSVESVCPIFIRASMFLLQSSQYVTSSVKAICSLKTLVTIYKATSWCRNPEDHNMEN